MALQEAGQYRTRSDWTQASPIANTGFRLRFPIDQQRQRLPELRRICAQPLHFPKFGPRYRGGRVRFDFHATDGNSSRKYFHLDHVQWAETTDLRRGQYSLHHQPSHSLV